jgi:NADH dehydrogenase FAD-containing subunit
MQVIGMYGYVDKYDFVIATARTLNIMGKSVLVIDATSDNKYKYIIPSIDNNPKYITQYGEIDFAIGFESYEDVEEYIAMFC